MIKFIKEKSTIKDATTVWSANQPIILVYTNDDNPDYMEQTLNGIKFISYQFNGEYTFDLTDYVRSQFNYQKEPTSVYNSYGMDFYTDSDLSIKIEIPMMYNAQGFETQNVTFSNCLVDRKNDYLNEKSEDGFLTKMENLKGGNILYFKKQNYLYGLVDDNQWFSFNLTQVNDKILGIEPLTFGGKTKWFIINSETVTDFSSGDEDVYFQVSGQTGDIITIDYGDFYLKFNNDQNWRHIFPTVMTFRGAFAVDESITWARVLPYGTTQVTLNEDEDGVVLIFLPYEDVVENVQNKKTFSFTQNGQYRYFGSKITLQRGNKMTLLYDKNYFSKEVAFTKDTHQNEYTIRWINELGGWDYYTFRHKRVNGKELSEVKYINVGKKTITDNPLLVYAKETNTTVSLQTETLAGGDFEAVSFCPFSSKIQRYSNLGWEDIIIEDYEVNYRPCDKVGTVEMTITYNNQYGLSIPKR